MANLKKTKEGYGYKYTELSQINNYIESLGETYYQYIERIDNDDYIMTVRQVAGKNTEPIRGCRIVQASLNGKSNPAQEQGSALTYARRYSLLMAYGLATEDDDGEGLIRKEQSTFDKAVDKASVAKYAKLKKEFDKYVIMGGMDLPKLLAYYKVKDTTDLTEEQMKEAIQKMVKKLNIKEKEVF